MANLLHKFLGMFSLTEEYDDEDEDMDDDMFEDDEDEQPSFFKSKKITKSFDNDFEDEPKVEKKNNVLQYNKKTSKSSGMSVCIIKPTSFDDGKEIADTLLSGRAVILNLEDVDGDLAQRLIDFTAGACCAIDGRIKNVSNYIFVVTPSSVNISGDFQELLSSAASQSNSMSMMSTSTTMMNNQNRYRF